MADPAHSAMRQGVLALTIKDPQALYGAYMPYLKYGGLFIPTNKTYHLGDEVRLLVTLMDEPERLAITSKVVWITPPTVHGHRIPGIGVQFAPQDGLRTKIETYLTGTIDNDRPTHTL